MILDSKSEIQLRQAALHEASHAVVSFTQNIGVESVTIIPGKGYVGQCKYEETKEIWSPPNRETAERYAMANLAGRIGERRKFWRKWYQNSDLGDQLNAWMFVNHFSSCPEQEEYRLSLLKLRVGNLLDQPLVWRAVENVANELLRQKTLYKAELNDLCVEGVTPSELWAHEELYRRRSERRLKRKHKPTIIRYWDGSILEGFGL